MFQLEPERVTIAGVSLGDFMVLLSGISPPRLQDGPNSFKIRKDFTIGARRSIVIWKPISRDASTLWLIGTPTRSYKSPSRKLAPAPAPMATA
jgi:hypothetical protein